MAEISQEGTAPAPDQIFPSGRIRRTIRATSLSRDPVRCECCGECRYFTDVDEGFIPCWHRRTGQPVLCLRVCAQEDDQQERPASEGTASRVYTDVSETRHRPGLHQALAAAYQTVQGKVALQRDGYVSRGVRIGSKVYPLGRYLVGHLASHLDLTEEDRKKANYQAMLKRAAEKMPLKTTDYERARKARVDQQAGRIGLETGSWKRKL